MSTGWNEDVPGTQVRHGERKQVGGPQEGHLKVAFAHSDPTLE